MDSLIENLSHENIDVRSEALGQIEKAAKAGLSVEDGLKLIRAATRTLPDAQFAWRGTAAQLMKYVAVQPKLEHVQVVLEVFGYLDDRAQEWATRLVASVEHPDAARAFVELIGRYAENGRTPPSHVVIPLERTPRHSEVLFPALLQFSSYPHLQRLVFYLLLRYCQHNLVPSAVLCDAAPGAVLAYRELRDKIASVQAAAGSEGRQSEEYHDIRVIAGIMLDLFGYLPIALVRSDVVEALGFPDTYMKFFAVMSLVRHGEGVSPEQMRQVASDPEHRTNLYRYLESSGRLDLFPSDYMNQASFAEADMVSWLAYPTELGRAPDEIELMYVESLDLGPEEDVFDWYLFRFRCLSGHAAGNGWMAGVSGPYARKDAPSPESYGDTFSKFEPWESKRAEEHIAEIRQLMQEWREAHSARNN
jgi:hypothetical protein